MFDDLFQIHDWFFPSVLHLHEGIVYLIHLILAVIFLTVFRKYILETHYLILLLAFLFFGAAISIDLLSKTLGFLNWNWRHFFEDGFEFLGSISWLYYFLYTGLDECKSREVWK